jgi:cyanophycin synthetase
MGLGGVDTIEDLAGVKSVVVESVRRTGSSVLNADNPHCVAMARHAGGAISYFTMQGQKDWPDFLVEHVAAGGRAINREPTAEGWDIVIHEDHESIYLMKAQDIPATLGGIAEFNVANALAAILMAHCHRVPLKTIREALRGFVTNFDQSPGRLNVHDGHGFRTILDYAHNPAGLEALGAVVSKMREGAGRSIGVVGVAGDRRDDDIRACGALSARLFDQILLREDHDLRGRSPGAVCQLLREGAVAGGCPEDHIRAPEDERSAIDMGLRTARPGDLLVILADDIEAAWQQIQSFDPTSAPVTRSLEGAA